MSVICLKVKKYIHRIGCKNKNDDEDDNYDDDDNNKDYNDINNNRNAYRTSERYDNTS